MCTKANQRRHFVSLHFRRNRTDTGHYTSNLQLNSEERAGRSCETSLPFEPAGQLAGRACQGAAITAEVAAGDEHANRAFAPRRACCRGSAMAR